MEFTSFHKLIACICGLVCVCFVAGVIAWTSVQRYEKETEINAQVEVEKTKIEEENRLEVTRERMKWIPWFSSEKDE